MSLDAGTRLGPYEILGPLGAGGMGEVYRARDSRLDRVVAIKTIAAASSSSRAMERFEREVRAIAALNHPGICAVYDVGTSPVPFLVMELLDGETLHDRLITGPMPVRALLDTGVAVADAVATAHGKGIVHRDLKPANIVLTARGPKILDFGLARATEAVGTPDVLSTVTFPAPGPITEVGTVVGTIAYMSPEQLRGEPIDARTDLFSLGVVLYEMATGRRAFGGGTTAQTSAAILHDEPVPPRQLRPELPPRLERAIATLLEKDRDLRMQTASELRAELSRIIRELPAADGARRSSALGAGRDPARVQLGHTLGAAPRASDAQLIVGVVRRQARLLVGIAALLVAVVAGVAYRQTRQTANALMRATPQVSLADLQVQQLTTSGTAEAAAISPDGKYVAYVERGGGDSLRVRQIATGSNVEILKAETGVRLNGLTVTPDGAFITYMKIAPPQPIDIWQIPFLGGSPRRLLQNIGGRLSFSPDGTRMAFVRRASSQTEIVIAAADGTAARTVTTRRLPRSFLAAGGAIEGLPVTFSPAWSPDGDTLAVFGNTVGADEPDTGEVVFVDVKTGAQNAIKAGPPLPGISLAWLDERWLVLSASDRSSSPMQLWLLSYPDGARRRLSNDVNQYLGLTLTADRDALVTNRIEGRFGVWTSDGRMERWTQAVPETPAKGPIGFSVAWSGDDLVYVAMSNVASAVTRRNSVTGQTDIVAAGAGAVSTTLDGSAMAFFDYDTGELFKTDGHGANRVLLARGFGTEPHLTPDGQYVARVVVDGARGPVVRLYSTDGSGNVRDVQAEGLISGRVEVSRDGRLMAYSSLDARRQPVTSVCELPGCVSRRTFPAELRWHWTPDGKGLAYIDRPRQSDVWVQPLDGSAPRQLTHFASDGLGVVDFSWSGDGKRLAAARLNYSTAIILFRGLRGPH